MTSGWSERDSRSFLELGDLFVPHRELQVDSLCGLLPLAPRDLEAVAAVLRPGGVVAIADIVELRSRAARRLAARLWHAGHAIYAGYRPAGDAPGTAV